MRKRKKEEGDDTMATLLTEMEATVNDEHDAEPRLHAWLTKFTENCPPLGRGRKRLRFNVVEVIMEDFKQKVHKKGTELVMMNENWFRK